ATPARDVLASRRTHAAGRRDAAMDYHDYQHLVFERRPNGVVLITINRPEVLNATNDRLHWELTKVWLTLDADERARVAVVTGAGRAFSAGGGLDTVEAHCTRTVGCRWLRGGGRPRLGGAHLARPAPTGADGARALRHRLQHDQHRQADHL